MNKLLTATTLTLIANVAVAGDFYGGFASPELETTVSNNQWQGPTAKVPSAVRVSLYAFDPADAPLTPDRSGDIGRISLSQTQSTSYDRFLLGDPDAVPASRAASAPGVEHSQTIAARAPGGGGGA